MRFLTLITLVLLLISCAEQEPAPPSYTILAGQVNLDTKEFLREGAVGYNKITFDSTGKFSDTLDISGPSYVSYFIDDTRGRLFVEPGQTINLDATGEEIDYSGHNLNENNYLTERSKLEGLIDEDFEGTFSRKEAAFIAYVDSVKFLMQDQLSENTEVSDSFRQIEIKNIDYWAKLNLIQYNIYHQYFAENYEPSGLIEKHIGDIDLDNEADAKLHGEYVALVGAKLEAEVDAIEDSTLTYLEKYLSVLEGMDSPTLLHDQLHTALYYFNANTQDMLGVRDHMLGLAKLDESRKIINERYALMSKLQAGSPSPTFEYDNYKGGKTKLGDLAGKYTYIDVWATWCGPCLGEIPSLKALEKDFHDANVNFVSLSIDTEDDREKWRNMIEKRELGGVQIIADNAWQSDFVKGYGIQGIPHFILLDPEGNIVTADAPRPSDDNIREKFTELGL